MSEAISNTAIFARPEAQRSAPARAARAVLTFARRKPVGAFGGVICIVLVLMAAFAPVITPYAYDKTHFAHGLEGPSSQFWLGTDQLGRDLFSRLVYGARITVAVGFGAVLLSTVMGLAFGVLSGYFGGLTDLLLQRFIDVWMAFPAIILIISVMSVVGQGLSQVIVVLGMLWAARGTRVVRSAVLGVSSQQYIEAARAIGCGHLRIIMRYILPNIFAVVLVFASVQIGSVILTEATISFLGYGIPPPFPSWGQMLSAEGASYMERHIILAVYPGIAIALVVFAFNMLGDALRDVLDPRMRGT